MSRKERNIMVQIITQEPPENEITPEEFSALRDELLKFIDKDISPRALLAPHDKSEDYISDFVEIMDVARGAGFKPSNGRVDTLSDNPDQLKAAMRKLNHTCRTMIGVETGPYPTPQPNPGQQAEKADTPSLPPAQPSLKLTEQDIEHFLAVVKDCMQTAARLLNEGDATAAEIITTFIIPCTWNREWRSVPNIDRLKVFQLKDEGNLMDAMKQYAAERSAA